MIYIILSVLCSTAVNQILKIGEIKKIPTRSIFLLNYMVATLFSASQADFGTWPSPHTALGIMFYITAIILGLLFIGSFYILKKTIVAMGISLTSTISRMSAGLPLLGSLLLFNERPTLKQYLGMGLMLTAIPLASQKRQDNRNRSRSPWGFLLFIAFGINDFILKIVKELWPGVNDNSFLFIVFLIAGLTALVLMIQDREPLVLSALLPGILLGLVNLGSALFVMKALSSLPAIVVYPTLSLGIILLGILTGLLFWREKMTLAHGIFLFIAAVAVILIS